MIISRSSPATTEKRDNHPGFLLSTETQAFVFSSCVIDVKFLEPQQEVERLPVRKCNKRTENDFSDEALIETVSPN